ncbi:MAG: flagellar hook-basal body complex protein FliE [bacterium]
MEKITLHRLGHSDNFSLKKPVQKNYKTFTKTLIDSLKNVNKLQTEANDTINKFAVGEEKDIHEVMIKWEKADLSLRLMIQVREKIISAYETIMRMQI